MKFVNLTVALLLALVPMISSAESFNEGWTFWCDGQSKQIVDIPHDAMLHTERSADVPGGSAVGFYSGGQFKYEKTFNVPKDWLKKDVTFKFGGIYMNSLIFINDQLAGGWHNGYSTIRVNANNFIHEGENVIRVETDNSKLLDSRWYSGGGILRPVELIVKNKTNISDVKVTTISYAPAKVNVKTAANKGRVKISILDGDKVIAKGSGKNADIAINNAKLWSAENPNLYTIKVTLKKGFRTVDTYEDTFGVRHLEWSNKGFFVNGESVLLKGGCVHSDNGILGAVTYEESEFRKVSILKEYGYNAIRSAHNPCSEELLKACDELGMYVMDELWDMWYVCKNENDRGNWFYEEYQQDIKEIVAKDFNHPSVVMYSIGNEVSEPSDEEGIEWVGKIVAGLHEIDNTRPVTAGINLAFLARRPGPSGGNFSFLNRKKPELHQNKPQVFNGSQLFNENVDVHKFGEGLTHEVYEKVATAIFDQTDITGYNYATSRYISDGERHPNWVVVGTETYCDDIYDNWQMVKQNPYIIGDFMWTSWDYLGEAGIGAWTYNTDDTAMRMGYPWKLGDTGAIDILGDPTAEAFLAKVTWEDTPGKPYLTVRPVMDVDIVHRGSWRGTNAIPSWSWRGADRLPAVIEVYSSAERIELYLNGEKIGDQKPERNVIKFLVPYTPGKLEAKAYVGDKCVGTDVLESATGDLSLRITSETDDIKAGKIFYVDIDLVGENGVIESKADTNIKLSVEGGKLLGFGSANPKTTDRFFSGEYHSYYGKCLAAICAENAGDITITANAEGLKTSSIKLSCK